MKLKFHFGTAVPVLSVPPQFPRGALSSSISELHFATVKRFHCLRETAAPTSSNAPSCSVKNGNESRSFSCP